METIASGTTPRDISLDYKYTLIPGVTKVPYYGMYLAKNIYPKSVLNNAYTILDSIKEKVMVRILIINSTIGQFCVLF